MVMLKWTDNYRMIWVALIVCMAMIVTACGSRTGHTASPHETVPVVQAAVDRYVLSFQEPPVKMRTGHTGYYEQYAVDFRALMQRMQLGQIPTNAYENGGPFYYVLLLTLDGWQVKLIDMVIWQQVTDIQAAAQAYIDRTGRLPAGEAIANDLYLLDTNALGLDESQVRSVYSPQMLPLVITEQGVVAIDYTIDIMRMIQSLEDEFVPKDDLRDVLTNHSMMIPIHSLPYRWVGEQPVINIESTT